MSTLAFCTSPVLQCSLTPATRLKYSSKERDPFRLAGQLDGAARSGRACQMARSHGLLVQSAAFLQGRGQSTNAASCLIKAFYLSEGFVEVSPLYCTILQELLHSLLDEVTMSPGKTGAPGAYIDPRATDTVAGVLATCVAALRALLITEWEEAASLATWAARSVSSGRSRIDWDASLCPYGLSKGELQWVLHSIHSWAANTQHNGSKNAPVDRQISNVRSDVPCSVYNRLLQRPNHRMPAATAAHSQELLHHLMAAARLAPDCLRSRFELGWLAWKDGQYERAYTFFEEVLLQAMNNNDELFMALGAFALAYSLLLGGNGALVATAELRGLVRLAATAMAALDTYNMSTAVLCIAAFARPSVMMVHELMRGSTATAMPASAELRLLLPTFKGAAQPVNQRCARCEGLFSTVIVCQGCRGVVYCGEACRATHSAAVHKNECRGLHS